MVTDTPRFMRGMGRLTLTKRPLVDYLKYWHVYSSFAQSHRQLFSHHYPHKFTSTDNKE
jgi:hypothetical protein